jgi:hypothetical protein
LLSPLEPVPDAALAGSASVLSVEAAGKSAVDLLRDDNVQHATVGFAMYDIVQENGLTLLHTAAASGDRSVIKAVMSQFSIDCTGLSDERSTDGTHSYASRLQWKDTAHLGIHRQSCQGR